MLLHVRGQVSAGFFRCDFLFLKINTMIFVISLQVRKVKLLNRQQILIIQIKASEFAIMYSKNLLCALATT